MASSAADGPGCGQVTLGLAVAAALACCCCCLPLGMVGVRHDRSRLAEADRQWAAGEKGPAVETYRRLLDSTVMDPAQRSVVYGRLIDHEAGGGATGPAVALAEQAFGRNVEPAVSLPGGREAVAEARRRRSGVADRAGPTGPSDDAAATDARLKTLLVKRAAMRAVLANARSDQAEVAAELRTLGVRTAADLAATGRGRALAKRLPGLVAEAEWIEGKLADLDGAVLDERSFARRIQLERAGVAPAERQERAERVKALEEQSGLPPAGLAPLDLEAALDKTLAAGPSR